MKWRFVLRGFALGLAVLAVVLTVVSVLWQRASGPSYPVRFQENLPGATVSGKLVRTQNTDQTLPVRVQVDSYNLEQRSNEISFTLSAVGYDELSVVEEARFLGPAFK